MRSLRQPSPSMRAPRRRASLRYFVGTIAFSMAALLSLWTLRASSTAAITALKSAGAGWAVEAVLKPEAGEDAARALVAQLGSAFAAANCTASVLGRDEARAILGLQEPWIKDLPEVRVADLPVVIEVRFGDRLPPQDELRAVVKTLDDKSETDFVVFNEAGYDRFRAALDGGERLASTALWLVAVALAVSGLAVGLSAGRGPSTMVGAMGATLFIVLVAAGAAAGAWALAAALWPDGVAASWPPRSHVAACMTGLLGVNLLCGLARAAAGPASERKP